MEYIYLWLLSPVESYIRVDLKTHAGGSATDVQLQGLPATRAVYIRNCVVSIFMFYVLWLC